MAHLDTTSYKRIIDYIMHELPKSSAGRERGSEGLDMAREFYDKFALPDKSIKTIHIAGTSGKGSVAYIVEALLRVHGFKIGLTVSPHVYDIRERFQVNGLLPKTSVVELYNNLSRIYPDWPKHNPSYFMFTLLLALSAASRHKVDYLVLETGLGGRYDFTNVVENANKLCVLTRIGKDHTNILGNTYREIASQKAGIIQQNNLVVGLKQSSIINQIFRSEASQKSAELKLVDISRSIYDELVPEWFADYQRENSVLALEAVARLAKRDGWGLSTSKTKQVLRKLKLPGRFDIVSGPNHIYVLDGSHNAQKLEALVKHYRLIFKHDKPVVILTLKKDKSMSKCIKTLAPLAKAFIMTRFLSSQDFGAKAHDPLALANTAKKLGVEAIVSQSVESAVQIANNKFKSKNIIVTGSNYVLGEAMPLLNDRGNFSHKARVH